VVCGKSARSPVETSLVAEGEQLRRRMREHFEIRQRATRLANV
jgi:hypothetical protein